MSGRPAARAGVPSGGPRGAQAATRALRLLRAVATASQPPTLRGLAQQLDLSRSTAHRLLAALESEGFVAHAPGEQTYRPGPELAALALLALPAQDLRPLARPLLEQLSEISGETVTLELRVDDHVLIVDEIASRRLVAAQVEVGTRWPLHLTSTGKAILAALPEAERERYLARPLAGRAERSITDAAQLRDELASIRDRGYAAAVEEIEPGYAAVGAALVHPSGQPLAALSVGGPVSRLTGTALASLGPRVASAARQVSRRLGA